MPENDVKTVPARNNFKKQPVFVRADIADQNARPGYRRQWVNAKNPQHPQYFEHYLGRRHVGSADIGYCEVEPWTIVARKDARPGRKRDDDTSGVETAQTHGDLILIETPEENAERYDAAKKLRRDARARALRAGDKETVAAGNGGAAHYQARMSTGPSDTDPRTALINGE